MATDIFNDFATNAEAESKGVWEDYNSDVSFLIARANNSEFNRLITRLVKQHRALLDSKTEASQKKSEELLVETMAKTVLLGWRGEFNFQGQPMGEYSIEKAKKLLSIKDFRAWVSGISEDHARFKAVKDEEDAGN